VSAPTSASAVPVAPAPSRFAAWRSALARLGSRAPRASAWRTRLPVIAALSLVLLAGIAVLVAYHGFYDARFRALDATRADLATKRDEAAAAAAKVQATEVRLRNLQHDLDVFNKDVLGTRRERLAALIEDVYALTQKAGTVPSSISYAFEDSGGVGRLALNFNVQGRYADVKKLLFSFENNPRFLLLETVSLSADDREPDVLRLNLIVAHYFRSETPGVRPSRSGAARTGVVRPPPPPPAKPAPSSGVPE
jgi:Tfp pilus assembly protein PilO